MIFTQLRFIVLFIGCWIGFFAVPPRWRTAMLTLWGVAFYWTYAGTFVVVVLLFAIGARFAERRLVAWVVGVATVGLLAYFKMGIAQGLPSDVVPASSGTILIPLGFSYLSFELLHVIIERRRGRIAALSLIDLCAFIFLFPTRIAGPIKRYPEFVASVERAVLTSENVYAGLLRILTGLAKKFLVADVLALTVAEHASVADPLQAWAVVFAYALQIYFDFSAYSDAAIGFSRMLGITVPENFAWPYLATNIREFWNRWHMTLSFWVRDYVFVPFCRALFKTGLRSQPVVIAVLGYLLTFALVGAWHGLTPGFLVWGIYHGVLPSLHHVLHAGTSLMTGNHPWHRSRSHAVLSAVVTFVCVAIGWLPFMTDLPTAVRLLAIMFGV